MNIIEGTVVKISPPLTLEVPNAFDDEKLITVITCLLEPDSELSVCLQRALLGKKFLLLELRSEARSFDENLSFFTLIQLSDVGDKLRAIVHVEKGKKNHIIIDVVHNLTKPYLFDMV